MGQPICNYCDVPIAVRRDPDGEYRCDHECNPADIARAQAERAPAKSAVEKSFAAPVQEEATPTLDAATAIRVLTAVAEMYDGKAKHNDGQLSKARDGRLLSEVQREIADVAASVASALPGLLEASRDRDTAQLQRNVLQLEAVDHTLKMIELKDQITAQGANRNIRTMELANAVANHLGLNPADEIPFEELTRRLWELPPVDGFGSHKADLAELRLLQSWREQAIQDIEALPSMRLVNMDNREVISRDEVRSILRGKT